MIQDELEIVSTGSGTDPALPPICKCACFGSIEIAPKKYCSILDCMFQDISTWFVLEALPLEAEMDVLLTHWHTLPPPPPLFPSTPVVNKIYRTLTSTHSRCKTWWICWIFTWRFWSWELTGIYSALLCSFWSWLIVQDGAQNQLIMKSRRRY